MTTTTQTIPKAWTKEELKILHKLYPAHGAKYVTAQIERSESAVRSMARKQGLHRLGRRPYKKPAVPQNVSLWSKAEDWYLRKYHKSLSYRKIAQNLGKDVKNVRNRAYYLGLRKYFQREKKREFEPLLKDFFVRLNIYAKQAQDRGLNPDVGLFIKEYRKLNMQKENFSMGS